MNLIGILFDRHVSWFGLMTYDMTGPWDGSTGHHSVLYPHDPEDTRSMVREEMISYCIPNGESGSTRIGLANFS